jgi:hypothetical protein
MKRVKQGTERWALQKVFGGMMGEAGQSRFYAAGAALRVCDGQRTSLNLYKISIGGGMIANCDVQVNDDPIQLSHQADLDHSTYSDVIKLEMDEILAGFRSESYFTRPKQYLDLMDDLLLSLHRNESGDLGLDERLRSNVHERLVATGHLEVTSPGRYRVTEEGALAYLSYLSFKVAAGAETYDNVQRRIDFLIEDEMPTGPSQNWSFDTIPMFVPECEQMPLTERLEEVRAKVSIAFNDAPEFSM